MKKAFYFLLVMAISTSCSKGKFKKEETPNWDAIKQNASFIIHDDSYEAPQIQPINVGGWEDGLYITRDGKQLYSTYIPVDITSWLENFEPCIDFRPYYRGPLLGIDTITNPWGCENYMQSDIVFTNRSTLENAFPSWQASNLNHALTFDGGACGVQLHSDSFDVFVFTTDTGATGVDLRFMRNVSSNPNYADAKSILVTESAEDNPHIERLENGDLLLFFDRDRFIYYSISSDNGETWQEPIQITQVLNDQAPFDTQPHLWHDGSVWWVFFAALNENGIRCIYKSKQSIADDWDSWSERELVIEPIPEIGDDGYIYGIGEPTLTSWGDLSFAVVYGNHKVKSDNDVYDCDPWIMRKKSSQASY